MATGSPPDRLRQRTRFTCSADGLGRLAPGWRRQVRPRRTGPVQLL